MSYIGNRDKGQNIGFFIIPPRYHMFARQQTVRSILITFIGVLRSYCTVLNICRKENTPKLMI
jgi:hypothetical protein